MNRDDYFRCKICKQLFSHDEGILDLDKGYMCPNGCTPPYEQPSYQSPLQDNE